MTTPHIIAVLTATLLGGVVLGVVVHCGWRYFAPAKENRT